jgi:hypothetical protein
MGRRNVTWIAIGACLLWLVEVVTAGAGPTGAARTTEIYPLGDSITVGVAPPQPTPGGYRSFLDEALAEAGVAHHFVGSTTANPSTTLTAADLEHHDGHSGYRIEQVDLDLDGVAGAYDDGDGDPTTWAVDVTEATPNVLTFALFVSADV